MTTTIFKVDIKKNKSISRLKDIIKVKKKVPEFDNFSADKIKLWKAEISGNYINLLSNFLLQNNNELLAIKKTLKYFPDLPVEEYNYVLVESLVLIATLSHE
ncbi:hypothetical protein C1645_817719 [Glomus cerebriforme]|uniref:Crinkler effector protein N-terminal domain-containing protein n=1 Tax=Glomus cerebriforme TaxID=658196 RepID=A0A397T8U6_9GLOM|nr:hypothetical protein C1645_817719 [Glomus cerebriforme]